MNIVCDLFLNFQDIAFEFFEWQKQDEIEHIKKIPLYRVEMEVIQDIMSKKIKVSTDFLEEIYNITEKYDLNKLEYVCCFSDGQMSVAVEFQKDGTLIYKSRMLLEDEEEICKYAKTKEEIVLDYKVLNEEVELSFFTRRERKVKNFLEREILKTYKQKEYSKMKYLYLEYFETVETDINIMKEELIKSMQESLNERHWKLYEMLLLLLQKKKV